MEDKTGFTCDIQNTNIKPNYSIYFYNGEKQVGSLDFNGPSMVFEGDAEDSAKLFMDFLAQSFNGRLNDEFEKGKKECAALNDQQAARIAVLEAKLATARKALELCESALDECGEYPITHAAVIEALAAIGEAQPASFDVAKAIHYPECWDTACYPTIADALREIAAFRCTNCAQPASAEVKPIIDPNCTCDEHGACAYCWNGKKNDAAAPTPPQQPRQESEIDSRLFYAIEAAYNLINDHGITGDSADLVEQTYHDLLLDERELCNKDEIAAEALEEAIKIIDDEEVRETTYCMQTYEEGGKFKYTILEKLRALAAQKRETGK